MVELPEKGKEEEKIHDGSNCPLCYKKHIDLRDKVQWQTQFDPKWGDRKAQSVACKKTCDDILIKNGLSATSKLAKDLYQIALENTSHTELIINTEEGKKGIDYLNQELEKGVPVQVGVDHALNYKKGKLNEGTTDHFIVIIGKGCEKGKIYYLFYDVGTVFKEKGANDNNRLYLDQLHYSLKGKTIYNGNNYTVTQIRKNRII